MEFKYEKLCKLIEKAKKKTGMTQSEIEKDIGLPDTILSRILNEHREPTKNHLKLICKYFNEREINFYYFN